MCPVSEHYVFWRWVSSRTLLSHVLLITQLVEYSGGGVGWGGVGGLIIIATSKENPGGWEGFE